MICYINLSCLKPKILFFNWISHTAPRGPIGNTAVVLSPQCKIGLCPKLGWGSGATSCIIAQWYSAGSISQGPQKIKKKFLIILIFETFQKTIRKNICFVFVSKYLKIAFEIKCSFHFPLQVHCSQQFATAQIQVAL